MRRKACYHVANAFLSRLELILAHIQAENLQTVQKLCFWQKAPGVIGLIKKETLLKILSRLMNKWRKKSLLDLSFCISLVRENLFLSGKSWGILKRDACGNHV